MICLLHIGIACHGNRSHQPEVEFVVMTIQPLILTPVMLVMTIAMFVKLHLKKRERPSNSGDSSIFYQFQATIVAVCFFFSLTQISYLALFALHATENDSDLRALPFTMFFCTLNVTVNFFIYVVTSRVFRKALFELVPKGTCKCSISCLKIDA